MFIFCFFIFTQEDNDFIQEYNENSHTITKLDLNTQTMNFEEKYQNDTILYIGNGACYEYNSQTDIKYSQCEYLDLSKTKIIGIETNAFIHAPIQTLILPDSLQHIGYDAFRKILITELKIPKSLQTFDGAFNYCGSLVKFTKDESNNNFVIHNNIVYSANYSKIIRASVLVQYEDITYLDRVTSLACYSFSKGTLIRFEGYPQLSSIGDGSFESCIYLTDLNLVQTSITIIPQFCFKNSIINFLILPPKIQIIESHAFQTCNVTSLFLPSSITDIQENAFQDQAGNLRVFYFGKKSFQGRKIFSVKEGSNGVIKIFVPTSYEYSTLADINVTICSIDEMFVPPSITRCTTQQCHCNSIHLVAISLVLVLSH